jgi:hypothetical protein
MSEVEEGFRCQESAWAYPQQMLFRQHHLFLDFNTQRFDDLFHASKAGRCVIRSFVSLNLLLFHTQAISQFFLSEMSGNACLNESTRQIVERIQVEDFSLA